MKSIDKIAFSPLLLTPVLFFFSFPRAFGFCEERAVEGFCSSYVQTIAYDALLGSMFVLLSLFLVILTLGRASISWGIFTLFFILLSVFAYYLNTGVWVSGGEFFSSVVMINIIGVIYILGTLIFILLAAARAKIAKK